MYAIHCDDICVILVTSHPSFTLLNPQLCPNQSLSYFNVCVSLCVYLCVPLCACASVCPTVFNYGCLNKHMLRVVSQRTENLPITALLEKITPPPRATIDYQLPLTVVWGHMSSPSILNVHRIHLVSVLSSCQQLLMLITAISHIISKDRILQQSSQSSDFLQSSHLVFHDAPWAMKEIVQMPHLEMSLILKL